jgi:hypothetical protein
MLRLIAAGHKIALNTVQAVKLELARFIGFRETTPRYRHLDSVSEHALPCIDELASLIDAYHPLLPVSSNRVAPDEDTFPSVGAAFTDIALAIITEIRDPFDIPMITQKNLITCVFIILHKHDLESRALDYLQNEMRQALRRLAVFLIADCTVEVQQLALSIWEVSLRHWARLMTSSLFEYVVIQRCGVIRFTVVVYRHYMTSVLEASQAATRKNDEGMAKQLHSLASMILLQHPSSGVLKSFFKRMGDEEGRSMLKFIYNDSSTTLTGLSLKTHVLLEALRKLPDISEPDLPAYLNGLQKYLDLDKGEFSPDLMRCESITCTTSNSAR